LNNYYKQYVEDGLSEIKKQWDWFSDPIAF
jgi:hypothetical protein